jgi:hypothetical protein
MTGIAIGFLTIRSAVLADHGIGGFQPFTPFSTLHITAQDRVLTALGVVPQWVRLLFWPAHLSSEYGPPEIDIAQGPSLLQLPGALLLAAIIALGFVLRRRQPVISFGIAFACITLLPSSNFLLPAGIVLAERTLFLPSVGAMLIVGAIVAYAVAFLQSRHADPRWVPVGGGVLAALLIAGMARSVLRTRVWHDNDRLFRQAVVDSPRAYRAHYMLGGWHFENKRKREGEAELRTALALFPYDPFLSYNLAEQYRGTGMCTAALPMYRWSFNLDRNFSLGRLAYAWCLVSEGQYDEGRESARDALRFGRDTSVLRQLIQVADSAAKVVAKTHDTSSAAVDAAPRKAPDSVQKAGGKVGGGAPQ